MLTKAHRSDGDVTRQAIRVEAVELIATHGFKGFNLRELAQKCGIKAGSLYNHIESKEDLLVTLLQDIMNDLLLEFDKQVGSLDDPLAQIQAFTRLHLHFHTHRRKEVIIGNTELRSLSPENYRLVTTLRARYESKLQQIIANGVDQGVFEVPNVKMISFAIIAVLTGVGYWYKTNGNLSFKRLVEIHNHLVLKMLGASPNLEGTDEPTSGSHRSKPAQTGIE